MDDVLEAAMPEEFTRRRQLHGDAEPIEQASAAVEEVEVVVGA
jgi:hypothetical protein